MSDPLEDAPRLYGRSLGEGGQLDGVDAPPVPDMRKSQEHVDVASKFRIKRRREPSECVVFGAALKQDPDLKAIVGDVWGRLSDPKELAVIDY